MRKDTLLALLLALVIVPLIGSLFLHRIVGIDPDSPVRFFCAGYYGIRGDLAKVKIDLTGKLNPAILPDVMASVLAEMAPRQKPTTREFQQTLVQKLGQRIMEDPEVNYRVDLNDDRNLDPVLVIPESVRGEAATYSIRVPDPAQHSKDPSGTPDWAQIAKEGVELCALSVTFNERSRTAAIHVESNSYLYEGQTHHHRSEYRGSGARWIDTYLTYMVFRDILFMPYGWYGVGWYRGWYDPYYTTWHRPAHTRPATRTVTRYRAAPGAKGAVKTASGASVRSSRASTRTQPPKSISAVRSRRALAARLPSGARAASGRARGGSFRGRGFGGGK